MIELNKQQRSALRVLVEDPKFSVFEDLAERFITKIKDGTLVGNSEYETLFNAFRQEFMILGITELLRELEDQVSPNQEEE